MERRTSRSSAKALWNKHIKSGFQTWLRRRLRHPSASPPPAAPRPPPLQPPPWRDRLRRSPFDPDSPCPLPVAVPRPRRPPPTPAFVTRSSSFVRCRPPPPHKPAPLLRPHPALSKSSPRRSAVLPTMTAEKDEGASAAAAASPTPTASTPPPADAAASPPAPADDPQPADADSQLAAGAGGDGPAASAEPAPEEVKEVSKESPEESPKESPKEPAAEEETGVKEKEKEKEKDKDKDKEKEKESKGDGAATTGQRLVKSVVLTGYGGFDKMKVKTWAVAGAPGPGQVEVTVSHCGFNFSDAQMRRGAVRERTPPCVLGVECAGTVTAVGEGVSHLAPGDRVACYQPAGELFREVVVLPESNAFPLPPAIPLEQGAALLVDYLTAYFCLMDIANLRAGHTLLIHSCAESVGWAVTQMAKTVAGVTILGTAAASKHDAVKENGVTHPLNIESFEQELNTLAPQGVDIIIDSAAGSNISANLRLLKPFGRLVIIGMNSVVISHQKPGVMDMLRNLWSAKTLSTMDLVMGSRSVAGFHLGKIFEQLPEKFKQAMNFVFEQYNAGHIKPKIDSEFPFEQAIDAAKRLAERETIGKVLLKVNAETKNAEE